MPTIKDIIVTAETTEHEEGGERRIQYPTGEAPLAGEMIAPMAGPEREQMLNRLLNTINTFIDMATADHLNHSASLDHQEANSDYITRLITNEFFFYTQEPLTLQEFEALQNKITQITDTLPAGIHLVLGSFAVKNNNNQVMNVTPHICSGRPSSLKYMIKNHTAPIDVRYKEFEPASKSENTLQVFDGGTEPKELPHITVNGVNHELTFNNVVHSATPKGNKLNTIVDVCLDHNKGVGKGNIMEVEEERRSQAISHVVTSNITHLTTSNCFGPVTHVDPKHSLERYEPSASHAVDSTRLFGKTPIRMFESTPTKCLSLSDARMDQAVAQAKVISDCKKLEKELIESCKKLAEEYRAVDNSDALGLLERSSCLVAAEIDVDVKIGYIKGNFQQLHDLKQKLNHTVSATQDREEVTISGAKKNEEHNEENSPEPPSLS